ncbi:SPOR domain-containing protein [Coxiella-like endosymbiont]|uniref:SPOR domain-containing protein n=2 Tax=Coxiellaceae TaxID=118968 RepID=UPI000CC253F2|nr:hypothetical protein [Coxiella-like endosymbiont]PMB54500.1 hypothetical protein CLERM_565 [Coxiella-like endosymbiont]
MLRIVPESRADKLEVHLQFSEPTILEEKATLKVMPTLLESIPTKSKEKTTILLILESPTLLFFSRVCSECPAKLKPVTISQIKISFTQNHEFNVSKKHQVIKEKVFVKKYHLSDTLLFSKSILNAWVIQVAIFINQDNVKRLLKQVQVNGFDAYTRQSNEGKKSAVFL